MGKKLSFLFTSKPWRSVLLRVFLFGIGLFGVYFFSARGGSAFGGNFSFLALLVFFLLLIWLYFSQLPERGYFRISFLILILSGFLALRFFESFYLAFFLCLVFSFLFYLVLGLNALIFKNRQSVFLFLNTFLFLVVFLIFFGADKSRYFLVINILVFLVIFSLLRECFNFLGLVIKNSLFIIHNSNFVSLVFSFLGLELFWVLSLLPIGFINSAILLALFVFLMRDFAVAYFSGRLNRQFLIYHFFIFIVLTVIIFATSKWSI